MSVSSRRIIERPVLVATLRERDGDMCQYPGSEHRLDFDAGEGPSEVTIDHHIPQVYGKANGWTMDEIWAVDNLRLMCKKHNAQKGDRIPNADGSLPERPQTTFKYRRDRRATRVGACDICDNGHNLFVGEICASCGGNAQAFPKSAKVKCPDCDHEILWCWACSIGVIDRVPSVDVAVRHGEAGEWNE